VCSLCASQYPAVRLQGGDDLASGHMTEYKL